MNSARAVCFVLFALLSGAAGAQTLESKSTEPLQLAITFDDLPAHGPLPPGEFRPEPLRKIIATLKAQKDMPPVYGFINGFRVQQFPYQEKLLREWHAAGLPLGSHTWSHPEFDVTSVAEYEHDIARNEPMLRKIDSHGDWHWFRFPFLEEGDTVQKREALRIYLDKRGYRIAEVSMDFQDYLWNDAYARCATRHDSDARAVLHDSYLKAADEYATHFRELAQQLYGRDLRYILLMHVGAFDAEMLPELLALYRQRGFTFVTLERAAADPAYAADPKVTSKGGSTFPEMVAAARGVPVTPGTDYSVELSKMCH